MPGGVSGCLDRLESQIANSDESAVGKLGIDRTRPKNEVRRIDSGLSGGFEANRLFVSVAFSA